MHRRVPLARCSATSCEPSRPGRTTGPSLWSSGGAPGVHSALRRFAPATGDRSSLIDRAHMPVPPIRLPRLIFVGSILPLDKMHDCKE
jgi:hypothetical protein